MVTQTNLRVRRSFTELESEHYKAIDRLVAEKKDDETPTELSTLLQCFQKIQELDFRDFNSFFKIAGYHGQPFRGAGWGNKQWWGATWHRAYIWRLKSALRKVGIENGIRNAERLTLPFWDEVERDESGQLKGVPKTFGYHKVAVGVKDGQKIIVENPLFSYTFPRTIHDNLTTVTGQGDVVKDYSKPKGYKTVRYPLSGLVGKDFEAQTIAHNSNFTSDEEIFKCLNNNVKEWLEGERYLSRDAAMAQAFKNCLFTPHYTIFSNTTSATEYNQTNFEEATDEKDPQKVVSHNDVSKRKKWPACTAISIEQPHNAIHLAIGGFDIAKIHLSKHDFANGDMGENDTAAFDPIFYFHHSWIDRLFWLWQKKHGQMERLITENEFLHYPGMNSVDYQGPSPGVIGGSWLSLDMPLEPFTLPIDEVYSERKITSQDVANIEGCLLQYTYGPGSFDDLIDDQNRNSAFAGTEKNALVSNREIPMIRVAGINRAQTSGSMVISVRGEDGKLVGLEPVLSRRHVSGCSNCQTHLGVKAFIPLHKMDMDRARAMWNDRKFEVTISTRDQPSETAIGEEDRAKGEREAGPNGVESKLANGTAISVGTMYSQHSEKDSTAKL